MTSSNSKKSRGGARLNSGPKIDGEPRSVVVGIRLKPSTVKKLDSMNERSRSRAIEKCIDKYKIPSKDKS